MKQTVLIGLGGTGSRVVNNVAKILKQKGIDINDGIVTCVVLDTNQSDNDLIKKSGTDIPVIPTCDNRFIDDYLRDYASQDPLSWCPYSRTFGAGTMIAGASEMRIKSRLAFMGTMASGGIYDLQNAIEKVFHRRSGTPEMIRVLLVSSLSGGTGSGMFQQVALWLRKFFKERNCMATLRGVLLLPDIFIRTIDNIKNNQHKIISHYANTYAAVREMNAMNKIIKGETKLDRPMIIKNLFDSDNPPQQPIFDNTFFIDDIDAQGAAFDSIEAYEEMVAQMVYMQLYAPMVNEMESVEDNMFRAVETSKDPLFGSCGTAKAIYPIDDIYEFCALKASEESISLGWIRLDKEIEAMIEDQKAAENDGIVINNPVNFRNMYIKLFDEKSQKSGKEVGKDDKLFVSIKNDIFDAKRGNAVKDGESTVTYHCKVEKFIKLIENEIKESVTENGQCKQITNICAGLPDPDVTENYPSDLEKTLKGIRNIEKSKIEQVLRIFDENKQDYADAIIRNIVPLDMGSINKNDEKSLFGLFQREDENDQLHFVHPIAARYLLYKLDKMIEEWQKKLTPDKCRSNAIAGDKTVTFDNPNTHKKETMEEYWKQVGLIVSKKELQFFLKRYKLYNIENKNLCLTYETQAITQIVLNSLKKYVDALTRQLKEFFDDFNDLDEKLKSDISKNIKRNENNLEKTLFIYASDKNKLQQYESLGIDLTGRTDKLNEEVLNSVYGKLCAEYRPSVKENKVYAERRSIFAFRDAIVSNYTNLIKTNYKSKIELDIITAIRKESDYAYAENNQKIGNTQSENIFDEETTSEKTANRHYEAIKSYFTHLKQMSAPCLRTRTTSSHIDIKKMSANIEEKDNRYWLKTSSGQKIQITTQTALTFWGFNPMVAEEFSSVGSTLGANMTTSANKGYGKNELYCYSSIYGVKAEDIPKFDELTHGDYYEYYSAVIAEMLATKNLIDTPHLDKTWHEFLPYISAGKRTQYNQILFNTLWLAVAYGRIYLDEKGNYQISEIIIDSYGNEEQRYIPLLEGGRNIPASDVYRLIKALKGYPDFESSVAEYVKDKFKADLEKMSTYVGTDVIKGLLVSGDLNPITMIVRYASARKPDPDVLADMIGGLREIMKKLAANYDKNRSDDLVEEASIRLLYKLYEKCELATKKTALKNSSLIKDFINKKLLADDGDNGGTGSPVVEDII